MVAKDPGAYLCSVEILCALILSHAGDSGNSRLTASASTCGSLEEVKRYHDQPANYRVESELCDYLNPALNTSVPSLL